MASKLRPADRRFMAKPELRKWNRTCDGLILKAMEKSRENGMLDGTTNMKEWLAKMENVEITLENGKKTTMKMHGVDYLTLRSRAAKKENARGRNPKIRAGFEDMKIIWNPERRIEKRNETLVFARKIFRKHPNEARSVREFYKKFANEEIDGKTLAGTYGVSLKLLQSWCDKNSDNYWWEMRREFAGQGAFKNKEQRNDGRKELLKFIGIICKKAPYELYDFREWHRQMEGIVHEGKSLKKIGWTYEKLRVFFYGEAKKRWPEFSESMRRKKIPSPGFAKVNEKRNSWRRKLLKLQESFIVALTVSGYGGPSSDWKEWLAWSRGRKILGITASDLGIGKKEAKKFLGGDSWGRETKKALMKMAKAAKTGEAAGYDAKEAARNFERALADCIAEIVTNKGWECEKTIGNLCKTADRQLAEIGLGKEKLLGLVCLASKEGYSEIVAAALEGQGFGLVAKNSHGEKTREGKAGEEFGQFEVKILDLLTAQAKKWGAIKKGKKTLDDFFVFNIPTVLLKMRIMTKEEFARLVMKSEILMEGFKKIGFLDGKYEQIRIENPVGEKKKAAVPGNEKIVGKVQPTTAGMAQAQKWKLKIQLKKG